MAAVLPPLHPIHLVQSLTRVVGTFVPPPPFPSWAAARRRGPSPEATSKKRSPHLIVRPSVRPSVRPFAALTHSLLLLLLFALDSSTTPGDYGQIDFCVNNFNH